MKHKILFLTFAASIFLYSCNNQPEPSQSPFPSEKSSAEKGAQLFQNKCAVCHSMTTVIAGPALKGVIGRWDNDTMKLKSFIRNSTAMIQSGEPHAVKTFDQYKAVMPAFATLTDEELSQLISFLQ